MDKLAQESVHGRVGLHLSAARVDVGERCEGAALNIKKGERCVYATRITGTGEGQKCNQRERLIVCMLTILKSRVFINSAS